jgi:hypothetical protein
MLPPPAAEEPVLSEVEWAGVERSGAEPVAAGDISVVLADLQDFAYRQRAIFVIAHKSSDTCVV